MQQHLRPASYFFKARDNFALNFEIFLSIKLMLISLCLTVSTYLEMTALTHSAKNILHAKSSLTFPAKLSYK